jgi:cold shock CspA family protein
MNNNLQKGKLKRWNDDKGFGFIASEDGRDIFTHVSALKRMEHRPKIGDVITYQIRMDKDGKKRAINAKIEGVAEVRQRPVRKIVKKQNKGSWFSRVIPIVLVISLGSIAYNEFATSNKPLKAPATSTSYAAKQEDKKNYSCAGKVYCSEMTSCEEAKFYQNTCPGTKMDGDRDGVPCERQWCNRW